MSADAIERTEVVKGGQLGMKNSSEFGHRIKIVKLIQREESSDTLPKRRLTSDDSSLCFFPRPRAGCGSKIVTGKTDSALRLGMRRRRNRRKVEIYTWVGWERSSEENYSNMRGRIFREACTSWSLTWRGYDSAIGGKTQFTFMV